MWSRLLSKMPSVEFIDGSTGSIHADVFVMSGVWAFDRYGGSPKREEAQILPNARDDGLPDWIIVPPFLPVVEVNGEVQAGEEFKGVSPAYHAVINSLRAVRREFGVSVGVELHLPLLGMDDPSDESTPASVTRAIDDFLND
ncbi:hypothetical protein [Nocardiopsis sp. CNT312]|uniref:hypothetical protein n=1 Tax=Nocardiopsis sp. CNT312 TaxID=1137268 RepID=UPI0012DF811E|nr:hypothetical protein [Nocardiopsis sp. CNT312]